MRVKYKTRTVGKTFSTNGGTSAEIVSFFRDVANALIDMGAPLDAEFFYAYDNNLTASFIGETWIEEGGAGISFVVTKDSTDIYMSLEYYGRNGSNSWSNRYWSKSVLIGSTSSKNVQVSIHAVKSGDSFFFGFIPIDGDDSEACIDFALTLMRRLSDPSVILGYAMVEGANTGGPDEMAGGYFNRTLPFVEGFNYMEGMLNFTSAGYINAFPETDTGKIPLVPYFAGIEDIYYDKVYVSPMRRGNLEEKAFETDKGTFLIAGGYGTDFTTAWHNTFAFDITEAVNTAQ